MKNALVALAVASCLAAAADAASPPPVPESLLACARLKDATERVRCYDAQVAALSRSTKGTPAEDAAASRATAPAPIAASPVPTVTRLPSKAPASAAAPEAAAAAPVQASAAVPDRASAARFGEEFLPLSERPAPIHGEQALVSSITAVREVRQSLYEITLANGQIWQQDGSRTTKFLRAGDEIHIERHSLGSYHLSCARIGAKNWMYVTRIR